MGVRMACPMACPLGFPELAVWPELLSDSHLRLKWSLLQMSEWGQAL